MIERKKNNPLLYWSTSGGLGMIIRVYFQKRSKDWKSSLPVSLGVWRPVTWICFLESISISMKELKLSGTSCTKTQRCKCPRYFGHLYFGHWCFRVRKYQLRVAMLEVLLVPSVLDFLSFVACTTVSGRKGGTDSSKMHSYFCTARHEWVSEIIPSGWRSEGVVVWCLVAVSVQNKLSYQDTNWPVRT